MLSLIKGLTFARKHRPTAQAIIERGHQTWYHQGVEGQHFGSWEALHAALEAESSYQIDPAARSRYGKQGEFLIIG